MSFLVCPHWSRKRATGRLARREDDAGSFLGAAASRLTHALPVVGDSKVSSKPSSWSLVYAVMCNVSSITRSSSPMSSLPSLATTRKSLSTTCSTLSRRMPKTTRPTSAWSNSTPRRLNPSKTQTTSGYGSRQTPSWPDCGLIRKIIVA